jgi:peptidoglycan/LPS O-acetylase OafA/YrhL
MTDDGPSGPAPRPVAIAARATPALRTERVRALDGLRGVAILLVLLVHFCTQVPTPSGAGALELLRRACSLGYAGVDLFFVLSGYLIGGILLDHRTSSRLLPAFYARRFFRIVPLYGLLLASFFAARAIPGLSQMNHGAYFQSTVPTWSFLVFGQNVAMAWQRDIGPYWLGATWSLAVEEQFYLLMPLVAQRLAPRQLPRVCLGAMVLAPVLRCIALQHAQNGPAAIFLLPMRPDGLLAGVWCACLVRDPAAVAGLRRWRGVGAAVIGALGAVYIGASFWNLPADSLPIATFGYTLFAVLFAALLLEIVVHTDGRAARWLSGRSLAAVGVTSYCTYLFHAPIWYTLHWALLRRPPLHGDWTAGAVTVLAVAATLGAAAASWRWFEGPLLRWARRFSYA